MPAQTLRRELGTIATMSTDRQILISADPSVPFALVQDVLAASRDAGFTNVALVTFRGTRLEAIQRGGDV